MPDFRSNPIDAESDIAEVVKTIRNNAFSEELVDLDLCYTRVKNRNFMQRYNLHNSDVRHVLSTVRVEDYCETSKESGKPNAYVFSSDYLIDIPVYLKVSIQDGIIVISFHEPDRTMKHPFRR